MPIDAYLSAQKRASMEIATRQFRLAESYMKAISANLVNSEGYVEMELFPKKLDDIINGIEGDLTALAHKRFHAAPEAIQDPFTQSFFLSGYIGLNREAIRKCLSEMSQQHGSPLTGESFSQACQEYTMPIYQQIQSVPLKFLKPEDAPEVFKKVDPDRKFEFEEKNEIFKNPRALASLLNEYQKHGSLTKEYVEGHADFFKKKAETGIIPVSAGQARANGVHV